MAKDRSQDDDYIAPLKRLLLAVLLLCLLGLFLFWRIDSERVEQFRARVVDRVMPSFDWAMSPVTGAVNVFRNFQSYQRLYQQNQDLRRELQQMKAWKEAALQLEQENARLLDLNNVQLDPRFTFVTGVVLADSGSPFRQSVLINVGARDGIIDGWAAMDGLGLVGRISGVGHNTSRVILLTDASSRIPVMVQPSGKKALMVGDNSISPTLEFIESADQLRPGDRVMTSGDGGVFPAGLLIGQLVEDLNGRMRVRIAADYDRLEFLRVLRRYGTEVISDPGGLVTPSGPSKPSEPENPSATGGGNG